MGNCRRVDGVIAGVLVEEEKKEAREDGRRELMRPSSMIRSCEMMIPCIEVNYRFLLIYFLFIFFCSLLFIDHSRVDGDHPITAEHSV